MGELPKDLGEHAATLVMLLAAGLAAAVGVAIAAWRDREKVKEDGIAEALREVGEKVAGLTGKLDELADKLFTRLNEVERRQAAIAARCAAFHGHVPGWDGATERRQKPRGDPP